MELLSVINVTKKFGDLAAVNNLSFSVEQGEIFGIAGPNGAGKTTLFNLIAGMYSCNGIINFHEKKINNRHPHEICKAGVARTFQIPQVFSSMAVRDNVAIGAHFSGRVLGYHQKNEIIADVIDFVGLKGKEDLSAKHLSLFDKKLTMLAIALATNPELLLLDEPIAGLSPAEIQASEQLFNRINKERKITLIIIEHLMKVLMGISHRVMILNNGEKISIGKPEEVAKDRQVIEVYLGAEYA